MSNDRGDLWRLSTSELASMIRRPEVSPVEVVEAALARVAALNDHLLAFRTSKLDRQTCGS